MDPQRQGTRGLADNDKSGSPRDDTGLFAGSDAAAPGAPPKGEASPLPAREIDSSEPTGPHLDRRNHADRREQPTGLLDKVLKRGRRRAGRRSGERDNIYVDRYSKGDVGILLAIFILNIGDALFTLLWLQRGGAEGNPVMDAMLDIGVWAFLFQKCIVVGLWLLILVAHRNYKSARIGLWSTLTVYTMLIMYHLLLVGLDVDPVIRDVDAPEPSPPAVSEMTTEQDGYGRLDAQGAFAQGDGS